MASVATTTVTIRNKTLGPITVADTNDWYGSADGSYPPKIEIGQSGHISHKGTITNGSMGAVVYHGTTVQGGPTNSAWVLAWKTPGHSNPNQIYVEAGLISDYPEGNIKWDTIKNKLDKSSNESNSLHVEGAEATANISSDNASKATAVFGVSHK